METTNTIQTEQLPMRSPLMMSVHNTALMVIDVQQRLIPAIDQSKRLVWNIGRLIDAAKLLNVATVATEQYPNGLGHTVRQLAEKLGNVSEKRVFSCRECVELVDGFRKNEIDNLLLVGIESHVCVQQTALDMLSAGFNVFVPIDAIGSRNSIDHKIAIDRMQFSGVTVTTTEAAIFELCETSKHPEFKSISKLVQQEFQDDDDDQV